MIKYKISTMNSRDDIYGRGYVHWKSWIETYTGLIDQTYLETYHTLERCIEIAKNDSAMTILAKDGDKVIGFIGFGNSRENLSDTGEIYGLYVLEKYHNQKIGYKLLKQALELLNNYRDIVLWVLKENEKAYNFYKKVGFVSIDQKKVNLGSEIVELKMIYQSNRTK